jgi:type III pantothenate kinase
MILEIDCGNSFLKWRIISAANAMRIAGGVVDSNDALLIAVEAVPGLMLSGARLVSVRATAETDALVALLQEHFNIRVLCAGPAQSLGGVRNGYLEYQKLGLDRWLAVIGAYRAASGSCLILDLGTAVTSDFVAADGEHLGGFICLGMPLMRNQLRTHTRRIRYDDASAELALHSFEPGRSTVEAVERGCLLMLRGFVLTQIEMAEARWGADFEVFLTGGDASLVQELLPRARVVSDLVFAGLAVACPIP